MTLEEAIKEYGEVVVVGNSTNGNGYVYPLTPCTMAWEATKEE